MVQVPHHFEHPLLSSGCPRVEAVAQLSSVLALRVCDCITGNYQVAAPGLESSKRAQGCKREGEAPVVYEIKKFTSAKSTC